MGRYSPDVWRIFTCRYCAVFYGIDVFGHMLRPPLKEEVPSLRWLAYGSSVTHGGAALNNYNSYIQQAAQFLNVDVLNMGLSGACLCEKEAADFIAGDIGWDFATLELGINMRSTFSCEEFKHRASYFINKIAKSNPQKAVAVITMFPNYADSLIEGNFETENDIKYNKILIDIVSKSKFKNLYLFEGTEILPDFRGLSCDLIHPSDHGHCIMGMNLAEKLKTII